MNVAHYTADLVRFDSESKHSNLAISNYVERVLRRLGFETERIEYERDGNEKVNVMGRKLAKGHTPNGGLAYFGHTDVVPAGDWSIVGHGPLDPTVRDGRLYGRGSTDMKGSIACMLSAAESVCDLELKHPLYICCSADEERDHRGIKEVIQHSELFRELIRGRACGVVGEPTEMQAVYAHKGGMQIKVTSRGRAAHSSTREGVNANLAMIPFLQEAKSIHDETESDSDWMDDEFDPPSLCMNLGINDYTVAVNVTPPQSVCTLCFRPMPTTKSSELVERIRGSAERFGLEFEVFGENPPFRRSRESEFVKNVVEIVESKPPSTVGYGSEAGNLDEVSELIVLGPGSIKQAHQNDEWISLKQLAAGEEGFRKLIQSYCMS